MAGEAHSFRNVIVYIFLGGVIMFVAIFLGIQAGFAIKGDGVGDLNPETLPNRSLLKPGDAIPPLPVYTLAGSQSMLLEDVIGGKRTVVGVVMPGCDPCKTLLGEWGDKGILNDLNDFQIILLASTPAENRDLGPLADFAERYPVYFCDHVALKEQFGISTFPSIMGFGDDNSVSFVANGYVHQLDVEFFEEYL